MNKEDLEAKARGVVGHNRLAIQMYIQAYETGGPTAADKYVKDRAKLAKLLEPLKKGIELSRSLTEKDYQIVVGHC